MKQTGNPAERAGRAAKTARRLRRDRERAWEAAAFVLIAVPLLFAAVWTRTEVTSQLRARDHLYAERDSLESAVLSLSSRKTRLSGWEEVDRRLARSGLRPPTGTEVLWVRIGRD